MMKRGALEKSKIEVTDDQIQKIADGVNGDARKALTLLESIISASDEEQGK